MKEKLVVLLAIITLLLCACGNTGEALSPATETTAADAAEDILSTAQAPVTVPPAPTAEQKLTPEALGRTAASVFMYMQEGAMTTVPALLHIGEGYSLYIPSRGWQLTTDPQDDMPAETWVSTVSQDVALRVVRLDGQNLEEAQTWVREQETEFYLVEDKQGGFFGTDEEDENIVDVHFYPWGNTMFAVILAYPQEASEGFGTLLRVMADTIMLNPQ